ncbi:uncharacterized protein YbbK (DUF523 family) [Oikeobacillus pervagus]|uniref:Uncharacterized protein YbbK (DUF523 family) n=1 Tax=Oikeobacillus pervagus TaxID=1325931 RepID=A0AAJ1WLL9_9BACI|nr:DUF523 domain-containing protein [Oikeobacillus pervagus]MDQ0216346.1 uncharacterized protein YbbK (DUF523 family) [Oikeobacillus pervagus]
MIVVSACLAGVACRYDGRDNGLEKLQQEMKEGRAITVCPELLGGLSTPREPAEIIGGTAEDVLRGEAKVMNRSGEDVTSSFVKGAYEALKIVQEIQPEYIILKENSPSCGSHHIYDGTFSGQKIIGNGITTALLKSKGFQVISEKDFEKMKN